MRWIGIMFLLIILSRQDLACREIDGRFLLLPLLFGMMAVCRGSDRAAGSLLAMAPGLLLTAVSLAGGSVGEGDGLLFWSLGFVMPFWCGFFLLSASLLLAGIAGTVRILMAGTGRLERFRKERLPMLPAVTLVYALALPVLMQGGAG